jgi:HK97 family phage portal protein
MAFWNRRRAEDRALDKQTGPAVMLSSLPGSVTPENALKLADVWAAVRVLSDAAASIPLVPYRRTESGRERIISGRIAELLERPAPWTTQPNLVAQLMAHLQLHGNAFVGKYRDGAEVAVLGALPPDRVRVELKAGRVLFELTGPRGEKTLHTDADVVHIKGMSTDGLIGLSPIRQAAAALGLSDSVTQHAATFFRNDATPRGVLKVGAVNQEQVESGLDKWNAGHQGPEKAHRSPSSAVRSTTCR